MLKSLLLTCVLTIHGAVDSDRFPLDDSPELDSSLKEFYDSFEKKSRGCPVVNKMVVHQLLNLDDLELESERAIEFSQNSNVPKNTASARF